MIKPVITFLLFLILFTAGNISGQSCTGGPMGFLAFRSQSPLQQLRFGMQYHPPWVAPTGTLKMYFEHLWKNMWLYKPDYYLIDAEIHEFAVRCCYGLGRNFEISAELPVRYVSGGILDRMIEGFHNGIGIDNAGRDEFPRNQFAFAINNGVGEGGWTYAGSEQTGWNIGNAVVAASYAFHDPESGGTSGVITANVKLPTGTRSEYFGGQSVDFGISLSTMSRTGNFYIYACPGMAYYTDKEMINIPLEQWHFSALLAVEYHPKTSRHSWISQLIIESGIAMEFSEFTSNTYELIFAYKRSLSDNMTLEIGILENLFFFDNSPDVGFHFGITKILKS